MFGYALVLLFLLKLRFPAHKSLNTIILERYGRTGLQSVRSLEKVDYKLMKATEDLSFLRCCQNNGLAPKFLRFKLYSSNIRNNADYQRYQGKLLRQEAQLKETNIVSLTHDKARAVEHLKGLLSFLDFPHITGIVYHTNEHKAHSIRLTHDK